jgi:ParB family chromosome partitioning protein
MREVELSRSGELPATPSQSDATFADGLSESPVTRINEIPLDDIVPNPNQPRRQMLEASIAELAASLKGNGLFQPVVVRREGDHYELIAGERRWRAARLAGLTTIPAIVRNVDSLNQAQMALVENIQRENLNPVDRALAYRTLLKQLGLTQAELANRLGEDRSTIANFLRLLDLPESVQTLVADGKLSHGHAKLIAGVPDILEQERLGKISIAQELSVRNLERMIQSGISRPAPREEATNPSAYIQDLEKSLSRQLGMRVQVRAGGKKKSKGKLILYYGSLDQFDDLMSKLGVSAE